MRNAQVRNGMDFATWENEVPAAITGDPLWRVQVYRLALFAAEIGWHDVTKLMKDHRSRGLSDQLYRALGSIGANVAEGYSRSSHKDQARFYEYALGSARESRDWYYKGRHVLGDEVLAHRLELLTGIIRLLLRMASERRGKKLGEPNVTYDFNDEDPTKIDAPTRLENSDDLIVKPGPAPSGRFANAIAQVQDFAAENLTVRIAQLQSDLVGVTVSEMSKLGADYHINQDLLLAAAAIRSASAQISVIIHAVGILHTLPHILHDDEVIESLSLGAGSAASEFDLVTDQRIAEFKFTHWKGGANAMRKKKLFEDYYKLACANTNKMRFLYLLDAAKPRSFLQGNSSPLNLLNKNQTLQQDFRDRFSTRFKTTGAFYRAHSEQIKLIDLHKTVPGFAEFMDVLKDEVDEE